MMRSIKNKRGQEQTGLGTIITLGLLIAAAILIGLFLWKVWGKVGSAIDPQDPATISAVKGCELGVQSLKESGYCNQFKEVKVARSNQWINCKYMAQDLKLNFTGYEQYVAATCAGAETIYCNQLNISHADDTTTWKETVNGKVCNAKGWNIVA